VEPVGGWVVIADGMGGHGAGEVASEVAVQSLAKLLPTVCTRERLIDAIQIANERLHKAMSVEGGSPAMGTTVVGILLRGNSCTFFNVGDSRAYILRGWVLTRHSVDHTPDAGRVSGVRSHALTQSLGGTLTRRRLNPNVQEIAISPGDLILLCSDGLTGSGRARLLA
jgi:PPM family protein phosphatase